jgi:flavin-dependent dehydrogenase
MRSEYDAIIVGAGPAGSTAAILLAAAQWSVALIEKQSFPRRKVCGACISASNLPLLDMLGIGDEFAQLAGPELREVALYCGDRVVQAPLPPMPDARHPWGRALGREAFDHLLVERARELGVSVWQPWTVRAIDGSGGAYRCAIESRPALPLAELRAPVVIMANGSWEADPRGPRRIARRRAGDLFAFQANFSGSHLAPGVLPVVSFAGGYGGLVVAENRQLTLAGCIRRDVLKACRVNAAGRTAGDAFEEYLREHTGALRNVLEGARREGTWLGIGPIQPGIRAPWQRADGRFMIGNAAAEAHPIIGEGISMAMQSARLLCARLAAAGRRHASADTLQRVGIDYARDWRQAFAPRLHLAATLAQLAMRPWLAPIVWPLIVRTPRLMTALARAAGKARTAPVFQGLRPLGQFDSLGDLH